MLADWVPSDHLLVTMDADARERTQGGVAELCHRRAIPDTVVANILLGTRPIGETRAARVLHDAARTCTEEGNTAIATRLLGRALQEPATGSLASRILFDLGEVELATVPFASDRHFARVIAAPADRETDVLRVRAADLALSRGDQALVSRLTGEVRRREDMSPGARGTLLALHWLSQDWMGEVPDGSSCADSAILLYARGLVRLSSGDAESPAGATDLRNAHGMWSRTWYGTTVGGARR
ncbi:hypothetical protein ACFFQW_26800 [Umezawaea endophytica]|uniref:Uncharacterized protein n=1 Tax=Umezawaea endophytica TaxID=1654476 RepID=A0A9X2VUI5_9PSEU|nr:hypothetical protein [Umezawaea endophytica]MCS7483145.1 hypothetical protein [Umezawaea endophytica]